MDQVIAQAEKSKRNYAAFVIVGDGIAVATGKTWNELQRQMKEALEFHLEVMKDYGEEILPPFDGEFELVFQLKDPKLRRSKKYRKQENEESRELYNRVQRYFANKKREAQLNQMDSYSSDSKGSK